MIHVGLCLRDTELATARSTYDPLVANETLRSLAPFSMMLLRAESLRCEALLPYASQGCPGGRFAEVLCPNMVDLYPLSSPTRTSLAEDQRWKT